jgi:hypothetical protein
MVPFCAVAYYDLHVKIHSGFFLPKFSRTVRHMKAKRFNMLIKTYNIRQIATCFAHYLVKLTVLSSSGRAQKWFTSKTVHIANTHLRKKIDSG